MIADTEKAALALKTLEGLFTGLKTASLATSDTQGRPLVSYAPVAVDDERLFYLFVSELADHTANLARQGEVSLMLIEDESASKQLFARGRLTVNGTVHKIEREGDQWSHASEVYRGRFGKFFDQLATLRDFHMFCLTPREARLVVGFGAAYQIGLPDWQHLTLQTGK